MAADRPRVAITVEDGEVIAGELTSVGVDLAVLTSSSDQPTTIYVALASLVAIALFDPV